MGLDKLQLLTKTRQLYKNHAPRNSKLNFISAQNTVQRGHVKNEKKKTPSIKACLNRIDLCRQIVSKNRVFMKQKASALKRKKSQQKKQKKNKICCPQRVDVRSTINDVSGKVATRNSSKPLFDLKFSPCIDNRKIENSTRALTRLTDKKSVRIRDSKNRINLCRMKVTKKLAHCRNISEIPTSKKIPTPKIHKPCKRTKNRTRQPKRTSKPNKKKRRTRRSFVSRKRSNRKRMVNPRVPSKKNTSAKPKVKKAQKYTSEFWTNFKSFCVPVVTRGMSRNFQTWQQNMSSNSSILQNISFAKSYVRAWNLTRGQTPHGISLPPIKSVSRLNQTMSTLQHQTPSSSIEDNSQLLALTSLPAILSSQHSMSHQGNPYGVPQALPSTSRVGMESNSQTMTDFHNHFSSPSSEVNQKLLTLTSLPTLLSSQSPESIQQIPSTDLSVPSTSKNSLNSYLKSHQGFQPRDRNQQTFREASFSAEFKETKESSSLTIETSTLSHQPSFQRNATPCQHQSTMSPRPEPNANNQLTVETNTVAHHSSFQESLSLKQSTIPSCLVTDANGGSTSKDRIICDTLKTELKLGSTFTSLYCIPEKNESFMIPETPRSIKGSSNHAVRTENKNKHRDASSIAVDDHMESGDGNFIELSTEKPQELGKTKSQFDRTGNFKTKTQSKINNIIVLDSQIARNFSPITEENELSSMLREMECDNIVGNKNQDKSENENTFTSLISESSNGKVIVDVEHPSTLKYNNNKKLPDLQLVENKKFHFPFDNKQNLNIENALERQLNFNENLYNIDKIFQDLTSNKTKSVSPLSQTRYTEGSQTIDANRRTKAKLELKNNSFSFNQHAWRNTNPKTHSHSAVFCKGSPKTFKPWLEGPIQSEKCGIEVGVQNHKKVTPRLRDSWGQIRKSKEPFTNVSQLPKSVKSKHKSGDRVTNDAKEQSRELKHSKDMEILQHANKSKAKSNVQRTEAVPQTSLNHDYIQEKLSLFSPARTTSILQHNRQEFNMTVKDIEECDPIKHKSFQYPKKSGRIPTNDSKDIRSVHPSKQNASVQVDPIELNSRRMNAENFHHITKTVERNDVETQVDPFLQFSTGSNFLFSDPIYNEFSSQSISDDSDSQSCNTDDSSCHDSSETSSIESSLSTDRTFRSRNESFETFSSPDNSNLNEISPESLESMSVDDACSSDEALDVTHSARVAIPRLEEIASSDIPYTTYSTSDEDMTSLEESMEEEALEEDPAEDPKKLEFSGTEAMDDAPQRNRDVNPVARTNSTLFGSGTLYWLKQNRGSFDVASDLNSNIGGNNDSISTISNNSCLKNKVASEVELKRPLKSNLVPTSVRQTGKMSISSVEIPNGMEQCNQSIPESQAILFEKQKCDDLIQWHAFEQPSIEITNRMVHSDPSIPKGEPTLIEEQKCDNLVEYHAFKQMEHTSNDGICIENPTAQPVPESYPELLTEGQECDDLPKWNVSESVEDFTEDPELAQLPTNSILSHIGMNVDVNEIAARKDTESPSTRRRSAYRRFLSLCGYHS